jgi:hypothetical protein
MARALFPKQSPDGWGLLRLVSIRKERYSTGARRDMITFSSPQYPQ